MSLSLSESLLGFSEEVEILEAEIHNSTLTAIGRPWQELNHTIFIGKCRNIFQ